MQTASFKKAVIFIFPNIWNTYCQLAKDCLAVNSKDCKTRLGHLSSSLVCSNMLNLHQKVSMEDFTNISRFIYYYL